MTEQAIQKGRADACIIMPKRCPTTNVSDRYGFPDCQTECVSAKHYARRRFDGCSDYESSFRLRVHVVKDQSDKVVVISKMVFNLISNFDRCCIRVCYPCFHLNALITPTLKLSLRWGPINTKAATSTIHV